MAISLGDAIVTFRGDLTDLNKSLGEAKKKVRKDMGDILASAKEVGVGMTAMGASIIGGIGMALQSFSDYGSQLNDMSTRTGMTTDTLAGLGFAFEQTGGKLEDLDPAMKTMAKAIDFASESAKEAASNMKDKLGAALDKNSEQYKKLAHEMAKEQNELRRLQGETANHIQQMRLHGEGQDKIAKYTYEANKKISDQRDKIGELAEKMGEGTKKNAELTESMKNIDPELQGVGKAFERIGLEIGSFKAMNVDHRFMAIATALSTVKDPGERAALAMKFFGRASASVLTVINEGPEAIKGYMTEAQRLGLMLGDGVKIADDYGDATNALRLSFKGLMMTIVKEIGPAVTEFLGQVKETIISVKDWVKAHGPLTANLLKVAVGVGLVFSVLGPLLMMLPGIVAAWTAVSAALPFVGAALVALTGPIGLTIAGIVALIAAGYEIVTNCDAIAQALSDTWEWIKETAASALQWLGAKIAHGVQNIVYVFTHPLDAIAQSWTWLKDMFLWWWAVVKDAFDRGWNFVSGIIDKIKAGINFVADNLGFGFGQGATGHRATGGPITSSGVYRVHANETVYLPQGAQVYTQGDSQRMAAQGGGALTVQGPLVNVEHMDASNPQDVKNLTRAVSRELESMYQSAFKARGMRLSTT